MRHRLAVLVLVVGISLLPQQARAQWQPDGVPLCVAAKDQFHPTIVSDGAGGAIITWRDYRRGVHPDIYAQRVDSLGTPRWIADGVALCTDGNPQAYPTIVSDGAGGAFVTWADARSGTNSVIYAQLVNATGVPQWVVNGVALSTTADNQQYPTVVADGAGGAIVTWVDAGGPYSDIYAQRVSVAGVPQWGANGVALSTAIDNQQYPTIVADGVGGAIVTWADARSRTHSDIYAQRVNASGVPQWTANGVALSTAVNNQQYPTIVADGADGAIVTWTDGRNGTNSDIYAQRVDASGVPQWAVDGVALCGAAGEQSAPMIVSDDAGGAIVTWADGRSGTNTDIYARRVDASGVLQWAVDGVAVCAALQNQESPAIVSDGAGGAIVTWHDARSGNANVDIYAQRIGVSGVPQWQTNGTAVCIAANRQLYPTIVSSGAGEAIVAWHDARSRTNSDIYAQHVMDSGPVATQPAAATLPGDAAFSSGLAAEDLPGLKSGTTAFWWSFLGTSVPALVGAWDVYRENSSDSVLPGVMLVGALLIGPSLGHFYADCPGPAWKGIGIRALAGAGVTVAAMETLGESTVYTLGWLAVVGGILGGASLVWDIARAPHSAQVHNEQIRHDSMSIGIAPSIGAAGVGLCAEVSF